MPKELNPSTKCTVNKGRDNFMCGELRPFMGTKCTVIRKTKAGLYLISLDADPKKIESVARRSIDLWPVDGHDLTNYEPYE